MNKVILITGGTGSFGSAMSRYLLSADRAGGPVKKVIVFSREWLKQKTLRDSLGDPKIFRWFIGDIRDKDRLVRAMEGVDVVIHAAAIKDLPTCENDPSECMLTNIVGTQNVIDACLIQRVPQCLFVSSDKAVAPCNAYGISKAMGESLWLNANKYTGDRDTGFGVVRYGNVVGSNGSVLPVFDKMVRDGVTSLPVTDERMTRYWFRMDDVVRFVHDVIEYRWIPGQTHIPELPSVRIVDICAAYGLPYHVVGIRPGEKIHETMGQRDASGDIRDSGNNPRFLTVAQLRETMREVGCNV